MEDVAASQGEPAPIAYGGGTTDPASRSSLPTDSEDAPDHEGPSASDPSAPGDPAHGRNPVSKAVPRGQKRRDSFDTNGATPPRSDPLASKMRLLLESTDAGIYGIDPDGRCVFVNTAATRMLGYSASELLGREMHELIHNRRPDR